MGGKAILAAVLLFGLASVAAAPQINVYVTSAAAPAAGPGGFVDERDTTHAKELADSAKDLEKILAKKVNLVGSADAADVVVEVADRGLEETGDQITQRDMGDLRTSRETVRAVYVQLRAGDYVTKFTGRAEAELTSFASCTITWRCAASDAAKQIELWIGANRHKLVAAREKRR
jgi:hypothetical protein